MTLEEYRRELGLSQSELAKLAGVTSVTISHAENGDTVAGSTARAICKVLSAEMGRQIRIPDVDGLNVKV